MNVDTQNHLSQLRDLLVYRLHDLEADVRADEQARRPSAGHEVTDLKDEAARRMQDGVLEAEERRDLEELQQVRRRPRVCGITRKLGDPCQPARYPPAGDRDAERK